MNQAGWIRPPWPRGRGHNLLVGLVVSTRATDYNDIIRLRFPEEPMDYAAARQHMIDSQIRTNKVTDPGVIEALSAVPREAFVAEAHRKLAYIDRPVPVGAGRRMTEPMVLARLLQ